MYLKVEVVLLFIRRNGTTNLIARNMYLTAISEIGDYLERLNRVIIFTHVTIQFPHLIHLLKPSNPIKHIHALDGSTEPSKGEIIFHLSRETIKITYRPNLKFGSTFPMWLIGNSGLRATSYRETTVIAYI